MRQGSISVALATYNGAKHLPDQLADLAAQSRLPDELVVRDDASSDNSLAVVEAFAATAPFPVVVRRNPARLGYRANFVQCAEACSSEIIAFCDQDDRWSPDKLATIGAAFTDAETLLVFHNARVVADTHGEIATLYPQTAPSVRTAPLQGAPWSFSPGFTQAFRRSLLEFNHLWPLSLDEYTDGEKMPHDRWYYFLASALGTVAYLPDLLADYRQHERNAYGWARFAPGWHVRLANRIRQAGPAMHRRSRAAQARAQVLDHVASTAAAPIRVRAAAGAAMFRRVARHWAMRASLYEAGSPLARAQVMAALVRSGAYGRDPGQCGRMAVAMDALIGLTGLHPALSRRGRGASRAP